MALLEIAIDTEDDGRAALDAGADRLEVCASLDVGGCTPTMEVFRSLRASTRKPLFVMLRPRGGSFVYNGKERSEILDAARRFFAEGADGFVFGGLTAERTIDADLAAELVTLAGERPCTFHRAFDEVADDAKALDVLMTLGIRRVLTSGGSSSAEDGISRIRSYVERSAGKLGIIPGGGVRPSNAERIIHDTGVTEIHSSGRGDDGVLDPHIVLLLAGIVHSVSG